MTDNNDQLVCIIDSFGYDLLNLHDMNLHDINHSSRKCFQSFQRQGAEPKKGIEVESYLALDR